MEILERLGNAQAWGVTAGIAVVVWILVEAWKKVLRDLGKDDGAAYKRPLRGSWWRARNLHLIAQRLAVRFGPYALGVAIAWGVRTADEALMPRGVWPLFGVIAGFLSFAARRWVEDRFGFKSEDRE